MAFEGWPAEALEFFDGLEADNSKTYWEEHKAFYKAQVLGPMEQLLAELAPVYGEGRVFRPYRDVRFSKDKAPYKTTIAARVGPSAYVQLSAEGLAAGMGMWEMARDQLQRYRSAVDAERSGAELVAIAEALEAAGYEVLSHNALKTAPKGYAKDHPRVELLRMKGLAAYRSWPAAAWLGTAKACQRVVDLYEAAAPLSRWLDTEVGPSTEPPDRWSR